ncbi:hypothetical protein SAMN05444267_101183 [Chryseobacterium polytrichastri]|uniref:Uncharacterized protein n=1 Tax=Chryseobacterium polytrichastri TaxID=1302687 RepID=A0A1M6XPU4_9FLAO|nr:hypothetical protein SAMN05444267_101183 [Chryseobacterium polytrichastri]
MMQKDKNLIFLTYTINETATPGWELQNLDVFDPAYLKSIHYNN